MGFLGSTAVIKTDLYGSYFSERGLNILNPAKENQDSVLNLIRKIKAGDYDEKDMVRLNKTAQDLVSSGAEAIVIACTELSLVTDLITVDVDLFDAAQVLAEEIVRIAKPEP